MRLKNLLFIIIIFSTFLGIGYAQIANIDLEVNGEASLSGQNGIIITDVQFSSSGVPSQDYATINTYYQSMFSTHIELGNTSSSFVTLSVTISNLTNEKYIFDGLAYDNNNPNFYSNLNIVPSLSGITENVSVINPSGQTGDQMTFTITFSYLDSTNITNTELNAMINFHFTPMKQITYVNCTNSGGLTSEYIRSDSYTTMNNVTYYPTVTINNAPSNITISDGTNTLVSGTDYTYSSGVVTFLIAIDEDLTITKHSSGGGGQPGTETTTNSDGSITTITRTDDGHGNVIVTGYDIDTTNVQGGSIPVPTNGIDTGVLVFDGYDFDVTLTAKFTYNNVDQNKTNPVLDLSVYEDGKVDGFLILVANNYGGTSYNENGGTISGGSSNRYIKWRFNKYIDGTVNSSSARDYYYNGGTTPYYSNRFATQSSTITITIKVYCRSGVFTSDIFYNNNLMAKPRYNSANNPYQFTFTNDVGDATVKIGTWTNKEGTTYTSTFDIIDFNVTKTIS